MNFAMLKNSGEALGELASDRPLYSMGFDPSSRRGASATAIRLRLHWLLRGLDVPVTVSETVKAEATGLGRAFYGPKLHMNQKRQVSEDEARELISQIETKIKEELLK